MQSELAVIIKQCQNGNKKAFRQLVDHQKTFAYQVALTYVNSVDDAMDISQDAFVKVLKNIKTYDISKPFTPWFYQIIKNLSFTLIKKKSKSEILNENDYFSLQSLEPNALENTTDEEKSNYLIKVINSLNEDMRIILTMKEFQDLSYKEISECLKIPVGTVMSRLYNARQELKKQMLEVYHD